MWQRSNLNTPSTRGEMLQEQGCGELTVRNWRPPRQLHQSFVDGDDVLNQADRLYRHVERLPLARRPHVFDVLSKGCRVFGAQFGIEFGH